MPAEEAAERERENLVAELRASSKHSDKEGKHYTAELLLRAAKYIEKGKP
jgi:hypothetical protein